MAEGHSKPFNGADTAWLRMDSPTNLMIINAMLITENMRFEDFKHTIINRFLHFPRFLCKPESKSGQYYWEKDPYFDIDSHVKRVALPAAADKKALQEDSHIPISEIRMTNFANEILDGGKEIDYFVMGHFHRLGILDLKNDCKFIFLGDWISKFSYGVFDGESFELKKFKPQG